MYRTSAPLNSYVTHQAPLSGSSNNSTRPDVDQDIALALQEKRAQVDEEITKFIATKEQEFREFEKELRSKKQFSRVKATISSKGPATSTSPSVLNLLGGSKPAQRKDLSPLRDSKAPNGVVSGRKRPPPISKPTLSLDRLNITGETTPPLNQGGTPPNQSALSRQLSRSPNYSHPPFTPPRTKSVKSPLSNQTEADAFAGLFTPAYLPLFDSRETDQEATPEPLTERPEPERRSSFSALTDNLSPTTRSQVKRALTAPTLPSTSLPLPSALRTASGTNVRKRKHVTFQLADRAIVDPSSSYEEMPSPSFDSDTFENERRDSEAIESSDSDATATPASIGTPDSKGDSQPDLKSLSSLPSTLPSTDMSVPINTISNHDSEDGFNTRMHTAEDGGSGVGFFELDEELHSPKRPEITRFQFDEIDMSELEGYQEKDVANATSQGQIRDDASGDSDPSIPTGTEIEDDDGHQQKSIRMVRPPLAAVFSSGSLPINIVKPSGSWVGSFGH